MQVRKGESRSLFCPSEAQPSTRVGRLEGEQQSRSTTTGATEQPLPPSAQSFFFFYQESSLYFSVNSVTAVWNNGKRITKMGNMKYPTSAFNGIRLSGRWVQGSSTTSVWFQNNIGSQKTHQSALLSFSFRQDSKSILNNEIVMLECLLLDLGQKGA